MNILNNNTNHPLIENNGQYVKYRKVVSIHSEDRNIAKFPLASHFEIDLPDDLINIESVKLVSWSFPSNYSVFSIENKNLELTFTIPSATNINTPISSGGDIYLDTLPTAATILATSAIEKHEFIVVINSGSYSPLQLVIELTNKMNDVIDLYIYNKMSELQYPNKDNFINGSTKYSGGLNGFTVAFNKVSNTIWFGNNIFQFELTNNSEYINKSLQDLYCIYKSLPNFSNYGLPSNLGLPRRNIIATQATKIQEYAFSYEKYKTSIYLGGTGTWITNSDIWTGPVYYIRCPNKINILGQSHFYMDISELNNMDETSPFSVSPVILTKNQKNPCKTNDPGITNGRVDSAFAKVSIAGVPLSFWYDINAEGNYKLFDPPAERIRKLNISIRYHNGMLVDFETFNYSFCLEFTLLNGYISKSFNMRR